MNTTTSQPFVHVSVLLDEVIAMARHASPRLIVDCTVGGGGHAFALLDAFPEAHLVGIDRDADALAAARLKLAPHSGRFTLVQKRFSEIQMALAGIDIAADGVDFVLADFGVSSHQLDTSARGFSFRSDGPLDMRMNAGEGDSARDLLTELSEQELSRAIFELGEERFASRVARAITAAQPQTTSDLARVVRQVVPASRDGIDPATRTFQALRMLVNQELEEIAAWLLNVPTVLRSGGIACAISFHSLEDRAVKQGFREASLGCICPPKLPVCRCDKQATLEVITSKAIRPSAAECERNPRARSSRMRAARKLPVAIRPESARSLL